MNIPTTFGVSKISVVMETVNSYGEQIDVVSFNFEDGIRPVITDTSVVDDMIDVMGNALDELYASQGYTTRVTIQYSGGSSERFNWTP